MYVTGVEVSALVDTEASCSFVGVKFAAVTSLNIDYDVPIVVQLPTGKSETTNRVLHCKLLIENVIYL